MRSPEERSEFARQAARAPMGQTKAMRESSKKTITMQSQLDDWRLRLARTREEHDRQAIERAQLEQELRAKADLEMQAPEKLQEEFQQKALATMPVSFGAVEPRKQAALDKEQREKDEHTAEIRLLGAVVAAELKPVLSELVTEIRALVAHTQKEKEL